MFLVIKAKYGAPVATRPRLSPAITCDHAIYLNNTCIVHTWVDSYQGYGRTVLIDFCLKKMYGQFSGN